MRALPASKLQIALIVGGVLSLLLSLILGLGGMEFMIKSTVRRVMRLIPGRPIWKIWETIPVDIYMNIYIFNITNAERLDQGEKPILKEIGPYVYLTKFNKIDITTNDTEDTVRYRELRTFYFVPELSIGPDTDEVTIVNILFNVVAHMAHKMTEIESVLETLDGMLAEKGEKLYMNGTVKDLMFDGVSIQNYVELIEDPMVQMSGDVSLPPAYADGKFALFKGRNGTDSGYFVVQSGVRSYESFTKIVSIDDKTKIDSWKGGQCNDINGTNAQFYQPFQEPGVTVLQAFIPDLCRTITWKYIKPIVSDDGINVARHYLEDFFTPEENPDNWCYCPHEDTKKCNITGFALMDPCIGAPLIFSKPHFYKVDPYVLTLVEGLSPNEADHETRADFHPFTGSSVQTKVRFQISVELVNYQAMPSFQNASRAYVPFVWFEQSAVLDPLKSGLLLTLDVHQKVWPVVKYLWMMTSLGIVALGGFLFYKSRQVNNVNNMVEGVSSDPVTMFNSDNMDKQLAFIFTKTPMKY